MKMLLLLCLGLTLVCAHHEGNNAVVTRNFDMSKISGEWYSILLASDMKERIEANDSRKDFVNSIQVLGNNSLLLKYHRKVNGSCSKISLICNKTEEEGICSTDNDGCNKFQIIEAIYTHYVIVYILNRKNDKETHVMELYAREPDVNPKLKERFGELCQVNGIVKENILDLTQFDRCIQARGGQCGQGSQVGDGSWTGGGQGSLPFTTLGVMSKDTIKIICAE